MYCACGPALYRHLCRGSRWALRLACKAGCSAVDSSVGSLSHAAVYYETREPVEVKTLRAGPDASGAVQLPDPARWVGVQRLEIRSRRDKLMQLPPRLAALRIGWWTWTAPEQEGFAGIAALAGSLRQLQLIHNDFGTGGMAPLADALSRLTGLQHLQLKGEELVSHKGMDNKALTTLAPALHCLTCLTHLELDGNYVYTWPNCPTLVGAQLFQSLAALTLLEVLSLHVYFHEQDTAGLVSALSALTRLQRLSLVAVHCRADIHMVEFGHVTQPLARAILALPSLQHLAIISAYHSNELMRLLQEVAGLRSLSLDIRWQFIREVEEIRTALAGAICEMTQLTSLRISGWNRRHNCSNLYMAPVIGYLTQLQELSVPAGVVGGLLTSPPLLGGLHHLTQLQLFKHCRFGCMSCAEYAELLMQQLPNLTRLRSLNAGGVLGFGVAPLRHLVFLQELDLQLCRIGPEAAPALAQALLHMPALQRLDIAVNDYDASSAIALAPSLAKLSQLHDFSAYLNAWGYEGMCALLQALKHCSDLADLMLRSCAELQGDEACVVAGLLCELKGLRKLLLNDNGELSQHYQQLVAGLPYLERLY